MMQRLRQIPIPIFLLLLTLLAYAPFFWERGFYWDEAPWTWIYYRLGPEALTRYFSTNRPFWGLVYQATLPIFGPNPVIWQVLMLVSRWLSGVLVWLLLRRLWPQSQLPLWSAALFTLYPGLGQNYIALMYTHFYIVLNAFLLSLLLSLLAVQKKSLPLHILALGLSAFNLLTMEYFYFLEFLRALLFLAAQPASEPQKIRRTALAYLPYLALFAAVTIWRAFFFSYQTTNYTYQTLADLRSNFVLGIGKLLWNMLQAFWTTVPAAWLLPFGPVNPTTLGLFTTIAAFGLALAATLLAGLYFLQTNRPDFSTSTPQPLLLGLCAWLLGGGAFWLVGERTLPQLHFSADRFTLPFMLGSSLILAALLGLLSQRPKLQTGLLALVIGFSVALQFQSNALYQRDWQTQRALFWQMSWRIPSMPPGTTLLANDFPLTFFSDNSLSGPLNWIYNSALLTPVAALEGQSRDPGMNYILYYASVRTQEGRALAAKLEPGQSFEQDYLATHFYGSTSQMLVVHFSPPGCFRVLDPEIDPLNRLLPPDLREAAALSNPNLIRAENPARLPAFYGPEPARNWCYYFSRAGLARQNADWDTILDLYEQAQAHGDRPNDPLENFVFIEALAHRNRSGEALSLTRETYRVSKEYLRPTLCALWQRIERETSNPALALEAYENLSCPPPGP